MDRRKRIEVLEQEIRKRTQKSGDIFKRALEVYPNGEISAARGFDPWPFYAVKSDGAYIWDVDGNRYLDCCMCYGVLFLGHQPNAIAERIAEQAHISPHFGCPHPEEVAFAEKFVKSVPGADMVVLCNSGNEAINKAVSIARAYTGKDRVAKFEGGFHGSNEYSMWSIHPDPEKMGAQDRPNPVSEAAGMIAAQRDQIILLPFGEEAAFDLILENADELAVVMLEPVGGAGGTLMMGEDYLKKLRQVTSEAGVLLLFDEVITGFRLGLGGGQEYFNVMPDIATFGKALGGGLPIGAIGIKRDILQYTLGLDPPLSVAGTFSGNAMTIAAANAFLDYVIANPQIYTDLETKGEYLRSEFNKFAESKDYPATMTGVGSMWQIHMCPPPVVKPRDRVNEDQEVLAEYALRLRLEGVFIPAPLHLAFISAAHTDDDVRDLLRALKTALVETFEDND